MQTPWTLAIVLRAAARCLRPAALALAAGLPSGGPALAIDGAHRDATASRPREAQVRYSAATTVRGGDLLQRIRRGFAMPDLYGRAVYESESWYAARPSDLATALMRGRRYLFHIADELQKRGMPMELALLPIIESAFDPLAYSPARASGLWQIIPATGKHYGLAQNWWFDAHRDVIASTTAALDHLQSLHRRYGDWHLALAAYNWGENALARAIQRNRAQGLATDYASLRLPQETRRYLPRLQALKNILRKPAHFGVALPRIPNARYFVAVPLARGIDLRLAAELAGLPLDELVQLNPGQNRPLIDPAVTPRLVLPASRVARFVRNMARHDQPLSSWGSYAWKRGDRVERIAASHGIPAEALRRVNSLQPRAVLQPGDKLLVPLPGAAPIADVLPAALHPLLAAAARERAGSARGADIPAGMRIARRSAPI